MWVSVEMPWLVLGGPIALFTHLYKPTFLVGPLTELTIFFKTLTKLEDF